MILDVLNHAILYEKIHKSLDLAFSFLRSTDLKSLSPGRLELQGDSVYALVQEYTTKSEEQGKWEAHKQFIDIQYIVEGVEKIGYSSLTNLHLGDYFPERDFQSATGEGQWIRLRSGSFVVFFPQDAHMPGLSDRSPSSVKKVVIKCMI